MSQLISQGKELICGSSSGKKVKQSHMQTRSTYDCSQTLSAKNVAPTQLRAPHSLIALLSRDSLLSVETVFSLSLSNKRMTDINYSELYWKQLGQSKSHSILIHLALIFSSLERAHFKTQAQLFQCINYKSLMQQSLYLPSVPSIKLYVDL